jgi:hypothetical protein
VFDIEILSAKVLERLAADNSPVARLNVYDGVPGDKDWAGNTVAVDDTDGRAHPGASFYASAGNAAATSLGARHHDSLVWTFQVTAFGGDPVRGRRAITRVRARLSGAKLVVPGVVTAGVAEVEGYDPGPLREDRDVAPSRWYLPLLFQLYAIDVP